MSAQQQKGQPAIRPRILRRRPETPQTVPGVQPDQQTLLVQLPDGQFQWVQIRPPYPTANVTTTFAPGRQPVTLHKQTVATASTSVAAANLAAVGGMSTMSVAEQNLQIVTAVQRPASNNTIGGMSTMPATGQNLQTVTTVQRPATNHTTTTKGTQKCHNFLVKLLELSSGELSTQKRTKTLIQELIDKKVEPKDFCAKLGQLSYSLPQKESAVFLEKSVPSLRRSLFKKELSIAGIRPPPANVLSVAPLQAQVKPSLAANQVRIAKKGAAVVSPKKLVFEQRLVKHDWSLPPQANRVATVRQPNTSVTMSNSQPPVLHPASSSNQIRAPTDNNRQPIRNKPPMVRTNANVIVSNSQPLDSSGNPIKLQIVKTRQPIQTKSPMMATVKAQETKSAVPAPVPWHFVEDQETKSLNSEVHTNGDGINDVAATGDVILSKEQSQKFLEFVGTQNRKSVVIQQSIQIKPPMVRANTNVIRSNSQLPVHHPLSSGNQTGRPVFNIQPPIQNKPPMVRANANVIVPNSQPLGASGNPFKLQIVNTRQPIQNKSPLMAAVKVQEMKPEVPEPVSLHIVRDKETKSLSSEVHTNDDDLNDVAAMGGVNLSEESQISLGSGQSVGTQIRSSEEKLMCSMGPLQERIQRIMAKHGLAEEPGDDVAACISHAAQERITGLLQQLSIITDHRQNTAQMDPEQHEVTNDVKVKLNYLAEADRAESERNKAVEREELLRAAKSRSKTDDPEKAKLIAKAKEMQRVEMEALRKRQADDAALQAIGPRKKPRWDSGAASGSAQTNSGGLNVAGPSRVPLRPRLKKATLRDLQFVFEQDKELCKSKLLYKLYCMQ